MFRRQSYMVNGKQHFFGGMAVEAVGGGWGLVDSCSSPPKARHQDPLQYRAARADPESQGRRDRRHRVRSRRVRGHRARRRWCWPAAASRPIRRCASAITVPAGSWPGARHAPQHRRRHQGRAGNRRRGVRRLVDLPCGAVGHQRAAVRRSRGARQLPEALLSDRHHRQCQRRALRRRGRGFPQPHLCQVRPRGDEAAAAHRGADLRQEDDRHGARRISHPAGDEGGSQHAGGTGAEAGDQPQGLVRTVREFNAACQPGDYNPAILDGKCTKGITPPKSNWALPIDEPPSTGLW